ncbi:uridine kinase [Parashewanella spongiae]|uniref:Uridine kinase n=1 Tax=Parashewanella spongiae TaxID=342950 RepID=A0A3A6U2P9_9GAMM|nr:uridine kinase [Parashewanella spongiae]MCL1077352.1 uridine kinase [Parashewanella spongiae]RJY18319.1 uridine kinase [Parashewanella spongiae]
MNSPQCVVIAITGASASGKSLIARTIYDELRRDLGTEQIAVINEDAYYHDQSHMTMEERVKTNYDHPKSMDHELLRQDLLKLKSGKEIQIPKYSYTEHTRLADTTSITPKKVIILEGILLLTDPKLRELFDASVFMDTPLDICFLRRLQRDVEERERTMESVISQYKQTVRPMFLQFIEPSKQHADIIVPRGGKNRIATDILKTRIQHLLAK